MVAVWLAVGREAADALEEHGEGLLGTDRPPIRCVAEVHDAIDRAHGLQVEACVVSARVLDARPRAALESLRGALGAAPLLVFEGGRPDRAVRRAAQALGVHVWQLDARGGATRAVATAIATAEPVAPRVRVPALPRADDDAPAPEAVDTERFAAGCLERIGSLKRLVHHIVRTLAEVSSASRISLMLREPERSSFLLRAGRGLHADVMGVARAVIGRGVAGRVAALGRPAIGRASAGGTRDYPGTAYVVLPLGRGASCEAVVSLTGLPGDRLPTDPTLRTWRRICRHAGLALLRARELQQARSEAARDRLTRLPNRRSFDNALQRELRRAERDGSTLVVALFDVDHFKSINDRHGHPAGDAVLREVARRLDAAFRDTDLVARWGGEEFAVLLPGMGREARTSDEPQRLLERARNAIRGRGLPVRENEPPVRVTISGGYAVHREHGTDATELLRRADEALLRAKEAGRDRVLRAAP